MAVKRGKGLYTGALLLLVSGIGYLAATGFAQNTVYELGVAEIATVSLEKQQAARLSGKVTETESVVVNNTPAVRFLIEDEAKTGQSLWVVYQGSVPDTFKPGSEVIIEGGYDRTNQEFSATKLMTKCPSKYEKEFRG